MKSLAEQMRNHDREQMSRMAHNLPEQYQECAPVEQVAQVFNKLFNELRAAFPASMANFRTQEDLNEFRRQWLLAFQENGIHSMAQVDAGIGVGVVSGWHVALATFLREEEGGRGVRT